MSIGQIAASVRRSDQQLNVASPAADHLDEVLEEEKNGLAGADGEVLLNLFALLAAEGWIGKNHIVAVLLLNVGEVWVCAEEVERLAEEAGRAAGAVIDGLADFGADDLDHGADGRARGVVLAAVAAGVAHWCGFWLRRGAIVRAFRFGSGS